MPADESMVYRIFDSTYTVKYSQVYQQVVAEAVDNLYALNTDSIVTAGPEIQRLHDYLHASGFVAVDPWTPCLNYAARSRQQVVTGASYDSQVENAPRVARAVTFDLSSYDGQDAPRVSWTPNFASAAFVSENTWARTNSRSIRNRNKKCHFLVLVPYSSFKKTAKCLHAKDLKLMRVCALRTLKYLLRPTPDRTKRSCELWRGYETALCHYGIEIAKELISRGFKDTSLEVFRSQCTKGQYYKPHWVYWESLQITHRMSLGTRDLKRRIAKDCHNTIRRVFNGNYGLHEFLKVKLGNDSRLTYTARNNLQYIIIQLRYDHRQTHLESSFNFYRHREHWNYVSGLEVIYPGDYAVCNLP